MEGIDRLVREVDEGEVKAGVSHDRFIGSVTVGRNVAAVDGASATNPGNVEGALILSAPSGCVKSRGAL